MRQANSWRMETDEAFHCRKTRICSVDGPNRVGQLYRARYGEAPQAASWTPVCGGNRTDSRTSKLEELLKGRDEG